MKGQDLFQGEEILKKRKYIDEILKWETINSRTWDNVFVT